MKSVILAGYSGHAFVAADILIRSGYILEGYLDRMRKPLNPFSLDWIGDETDASVMKQLSGKLFFAAIGDNTIRRSVTTRLLQYGILPANAIDPSAVISSSVKWKGNGIMVGSNSVINALLECGEGVIFNTSCIIEHECKVDNFAHIGPGAVLCGNVSVGQNTFIGAGAVIKEGVHIGNDVIVGAGAVIIRNIEDNQKVAGNPGRIL
ncbi:MAG: acetyltransferase [Bacteroidota bacterium]